MFLLEGTKIYCFSLAPAIFLGSGLFPAFYCCCCAVALQPEQRTGAGMAGWKAIACTSTMQKRVTAPAHCPGVSIFQSPAFPGQMVPLHEASG